MKTIYFILLLYFIKFAIINAAGGKNGASGSGRRKRPSEHADQSSDSSSISNEDAGGPKIAPIYRTGLFEKTQDPNTARCKDCNINLVLTRGRTSTLSRHLGEIHANSDYEKKYNKIRRRTFGVNDIIYDPEMFTKNVNENSAKCATCKKDFKGTSTHLVRHLERTHSEIYKKYLERADAREKERKTQRQQINQQKSRRLSSGSFYQRMAQNVTGSSNNPQQHGQITLQQIDPNIAQTLIQPIASAFSGQMVPSSTHRNQQTTQQLIPISSTQEMLQQLHVSTNQQQQQQYGQTTSNLQQRHHLSQQSLAQQMASTMSQPMQPSTISARPSINRSILNSLATLRQRTAGQESGSTFQQHISQMDKGKGIMTEEPRTQSRPTGRRLMEDAIRADRTSQLGHQSISQQYYPQSATQAGQIGSGTILRPSTFAHGNGRATESYGGGGSGFPQLQSLSGGTQYGQPMLSLGTSQQNIPPNTGITGREAENEMLAGIIGRQSAEAAGTQTATGLTTNRATGGRLSSLATAYGQATQHPSSGEQYGQGTHSGASGSITRPSLLAGGGTTRPSSFTQLAPLPSATQTQHYGQSTYGEAGGSITRPSSFTGLAPLPPSLSIPSTQHQSNQTMQQNTSSNIGDPPADYSTSNFGQYHY